MLVCLPFLTRPAAARAAEAPEAYRLRIANTQFGPVEVSTDKGANWLIVGRVVKPAVDAVTDGTSTLPAVERSSQYGMAFGVGQRRLARLLPDAEPARRDRAAIVVNQTAGSALFRTFLPPIGSPVQQVVDKQAALPLPTGYVPRDGDVLLLTATATRMAADRLQQAAKQAADDYRAGALDRVKAAGGQPTTGRLTVTAQLAPGEKPTAVTFLLDGQVSAIVNHAPFENRWDTRSIPNGEHVLEVRAVDGGGRTLTSRKALIVVDNR